MTTQINGNAIVTDAIRSLVRSMRRAMREMVGKEGTVTVERLTEIESAIKTAKVLLA